MCGYHEAVVGSLCDIVAASDLVIQRSWTAYRPVASEMHFYVLRADGGIGDVRKMALMR